MQRDIRIQLCTSSEPTRIRWKETLSDLDVELLDASYSPMSLDEAEIIVVDAELGPAIVEHFAKRKVGERSQGVIAIGFSSANADVSLAEDASARELRLASILLGQVVQLRRQLCQQQSNVQRLEDETRRDHLTGLSNRRDWDASLATWPGGLLSLIDIDHFKRINDKLGHAAGDASLRLIAERIQQDASCGNLAARLGGDEFGLLLSDVAPEQAFEIADRLRRSVGHLAAPGFPVTASLGFVLTHGTAPQNWMLLADDALRIAKANGRDQTAASKADD